MEAMRYTKNFVAWKHNLAKPLNGTTVANCILKDFNHLLFIGTVLAMIPAHLIILLVSYGIHLMPDATMLILKY